MALEITYQCELSEGIHARPAGHIARLCNGFHADIIWHNTRTVLDGNAKSSLALVSTDTLLYDECRITLCGCDEKAAAAELIALLRNLTTFAAEQVSKPVRGASYLPRCLRELQPTYLRGTAISAGITIARPVILQGVTFSELLARSPSAPVTPEGEKRRLTQGLENLRRAKMRALTQAEGIEYNLLEAHLSLISDRAFLESIISYLDEHMNAWSAIVKVAIDFSAVLERSSSQYIQERTLDVLDIATQILAQLYGEQSLMQNALVLDGPAIVLASTLTPSQFLAIDKTHLAGLVLSSTGKTSHTAILARSLNIPTLADIDIATLNILSQQEVVLDAEAGILITKTNESILRYYRNEMAVQRQKTLAVALPDTSKPLLVPEAILWGLDAADKNEAIKMMVDNLWLQQRTDCRDKLCEDIWAREVPFPTVVGSGFAIPHARSEAILHSSIGIARLRQPIAWGGVQVDTVFMLAIRQAAAENEHMKYFSTLARMLMNEEFVQKTKAAQTPMALYNLIFSTLSP
ncbi:PTS sugar transporter subunit IIA [Sodalis ligni]|uniref:PTS sugar transporter subunit IIA n=1 Tax=Sodalis ligni TaxID=2697027 RepID=UPI00193FBD31|nr:PTS sugar transporter subunit IIA [Sodalis ligni]QWA09182.1 PTS sugar transporter subunit IIA [Sodalis ligni]